MPYGAQSWGGPTVQPSTPMGAFGQQNVGQPMADDFLYQSASFFQQAAQVDQALRHPSPNGFMQDLVDLVGQHMQANMEQFGKSFGDAIGQVQTDTQDMTPEEAGRAFGEFLKGLEQAGREAEQAQSK